MIPDQALACMRAAARASHLMEKSLRRHHGVKQSSWRVLMAVASAPESGSSYDELKKRLHMDRGQLVNYVHQLQAAGLLTLQRRQNAVKGRRPVGCPRLTDEALRLLSEPFIKKQPEGAES